jgi:hypothetical protein
MMMMTIIIFNSIQFFIIYVPSQQPQGQLQIIIIITITTTSGSNNGNNVKSIVELRGANRE